MKDFTNNEVFILWSAVNHLREIAESTALRDTRLAVQLDKYEKQLDALTSRSDTEYEDLVEFLEGIKGRL